MEKDKRWSGQFGKCCVSIVSIQYLKRNPNILKTSCHKKKTMCFCPKRNDGKDPALGGKMEASARSRPVTAAYQIKVSYKWWPYFGKQLQLLSFACQISKKAVLTHQSFRSKYLSASLFLLIQIHYIQNFVSKQIAGTFFSVMKLPRFTSFLIFFFQITAIYFLKS